MGILSIEKSPWPLACVLSIALAGCAGPPDRVLMEFDTKSGQPIPSGLASPERWDFLGTQTVPGKMQTMTWVKPVQTKPRQSTGTPAEAAALLGKPLEARPNDWTESFEYQDLPRPAVSPEKYLAVFKDLQSRDCPTGTVAAIRVDSAELLLEARSGGCPRYGDQSEIDRFLFGKTDLFHMVYTIRSSDVTPDQRETAMKAVTSWNLSR